MKLYLCARWGRRGELREYAADATRNGLRVVSRWLYTPDDDRAQGPAERHRWASRDRDEIWEADALVFFSEPDPAAAGWRGGRFVEFGIALAFRKRLIVVGPPEPNCFLALAHKAFDNWPEALEHLRPKHEYEAENFFQEIEANAVPLGEVDP